jgi:mRNA interferase RelE/StbE
MSYDLKFKDDALKEWRKLDGSIREMLKTKLLERLKEPRIESARLSGMSDCYKIKLRGSGYRLVFQVRDNELVVVVIAIGKRDKNLIYKLALRRL